MTFDISGHREIYNGTNTVDFFYITAFCRGDDCHRPIGIMATAKVAQHIIFAAYNNRAELTDCFNLVEVWPEPPTPTCPEFVPAEAETIFLEAEDSRLRKKWNSAAMAYRLALEAALKSISLGDTEKDAAYQKKTLFGKIDFLADNNLITGAIKDWSHAVRDAGNSGAHEAGKVGGPEVEDQANFTRMALVYLFEMPERVRMLRAQKTE